MAALAGVAVASAGVAAQGDPGLELEVVRSYRAASSQTLFDALVRVPFALVDPLGTGPDAWAAYRITVSVRDSAGLALLAQSWSRTVPGRSVRLRGASAGEHFAFAAAPGRYTVDLTVTDSATGRVARQRLEASAFRTPPGAADLMLATRLRHIGPTDTVRGSGEIRKGELLVLASSRPALTPHETALGYYLEIYGERADTVTVSAEVQSAVGSRIVATPAQRIPLGPGGGATRGTLDLAGLPPGTYRLGVEVRTRDSTIRREAPFRMADFETAAAVAAAVPRPRDAFEDMTEAQLDTLYLPLVYLMSGDQRGIYEGLSVDGKRGYLRQFWETRDPTPGTPRNEAQEDFYSRIAEANRRFREGGAAQIVGWRTDRGRVFIKYGAPDEVLSRPEAGSTFPYEVWKFTRGRPRKYVFVDLTRFGNYSLVYTNDRREASRPDWQELLGAEAVQDIERF